MICQGWGGARYIICFSICQACLYAMYASFEPLCFWQCHCHQPRHHKHSCCAQLGGFQFNKSTSHSIIPYTLLFKPILRIIKTEPKEHLSIFTPSKTGLAQEKYNFLPLWLCVAREAEEQKTQAQGNHNICCLVRIFLAYFGLFLGFFSMVRFLLQPVIKQTVPKQIILFSQKR